MKRIAPIALTLLLLSAPALGGKPHDAIVGKVVKVTDGNTLTIHGDENTWLRIRLDGIDAPEGTMPASTAADCGPIRMWCRRGNGER
jgi:endonuclease YncB( thermonuclease family)